MNTSDISLKMIEEDNQTSVFQLWIHQMMLAEQKQKEQPVDEFHFRCWRCGKESLWTEGGARATIGFGFGVSNCFQTEPVMPTDKIALCIPCLKEVLPSFGIDEKKIDKYCDSLKPYYVKGEYRVV